MGILTPPASPTRNFMSPYPKLTEADMAGTTCNCGHEMFDSRGCCPGCMDRQQKRHYRLSGRATGQLPTTPPISQLPTPPPTSPLLTPSPTSQPMTPRPSSDGGRSQIAHASDLGLHSPAVVAINSAFASRDEHDHEHTRDIFPAHFYHAPRRASSRSPALSAASPARATTFRHSEDHVGHLIGPKTPSSTPSGGGSVVRAYSPMAAGFASMNRRQTRLEPLVVERRFGLRGSLDLAARMFDGPA